jgi:hypothetical protein
MVLHVRLTGLSNRSTGADFLRSRRMQSGLKKEPEFDLKGAR